MKLKSLLILAAAAMLASCGGNQYGHQHGDGAAASQNTVVTDDGVTVEYNDPEMISIQADEPVVSCEANDLALFLAGKPSQKYASLQASADYQEYTRTTQQTWGDLCQRTLNPIQEWCKENIPDFYADTTTLFYPFGGPDLIFAMTFFPDERDYVLFGLENPGQLCDIAQLSDTQRKQYLDSLQFSYRYLNKYGFFVARQMLNDFRNKDLNGTIHLALYTLALENCTVTNYRDIYLDERGEVQTTSGRNSVHPYGWELSFRKDGDPRTRTVRYLRFNAADAGINGRMEFPFFLNNIKEKTCYFKSASYLMQSVEFTTMQRLILGQCDRILQDESGFSYARIRKDYDVKLFGTYNDPVRDFKIFPQTDLKAALANSKPLPFKIGYAAQHEECVLMACVKNEENPTSTVVATVGNATPSSSANTQGLVFKVQFLVSWHVLKADAPEFNGLKNVEYYYDNKMYKYTVGNFKNEAECQALLREARDKGFSDAFIVKFQDGKRVK